MIVGLVSLPDAVSAVAIGALVVSALLVGLAAGAEARDKRHRWRAARVFFALPLSKADDHRRGMLAAVTRPLLEATPAAVADGAAIAAMARATRADEQGRAALQLCGPTEPARVIAMLAAGSTLEAISGRELRWQPTAHARPGLVQLARRLEGTDPTAVWEELSSRARHDRKAPVVEDTWPDALDLLFDVEDRNDRVAGLRLARKLQEGSAGAALAGAAARAGWLQDGGSIHDVIRDAQRWLGSHPVLVYARLQDLAVNGDVLQRFNAPSTLSSSIVDLHRLDSDAWWRSELLALRARLVSAMALRESHLLDEALAAIRELLHDAQATLAELPQIAAKHASFVDRIVDLELEVRAALAAAAVREPPTESTVVEETVADEPAIEKKQDVRPQVVEATEEQKPRTRYMDD